MKIHLLGDSLVQPRMARHTKFFCGWGDMLHVFFDDKTEIRNYGMGGRSSRSFMNEGRFFDNGRFTTELPPYGMGPALPQISKGDYVFIQFLCNDDDSRSCAYRVNKHVWLGDADENGIYPTVVPTEDMLSLAAGWEVGYKEDLEKEGYAKEQIETILETTKELIDLCGDTYYSFDCGATFKGYQKYYIDKVREKGAIPVLVVSGAKLVFTDGKIKPTPGYHGGEDTHHAFPYAEAIRQLGREENVPVIDLFETEKELYEALGEEKVACLHNLGVAQEDVQNIDNTDQFGPSADISDWLSEFDDRLRKKDYLTIDTVHKNHFGAFFQAAEIADKLYALGVLKDHILKEPSAFPGIPEGVQNERDLFASKIKNVSLFGEF